MSSASATESIEQEVEFILNIAGEQAFMLPRQVPGFKRMDAKLLPSNLTKHGLRIFAQVQLKPL